MEEKSNGISKYDFGIDVRVMIDQHAILNLLIRKGLINHREFKSEVARINEEIRMSFVNWDFIKISRCHELTILGATMSSDNTQSQIRDNIEHKYAYLEE